MSAHQDRGGAAVASSATSLDAPRLLLVVDDAPTAAALIDLVQAAFPAADAPIVVARLADARGVLVLGRVDCVLLDGALPDAGELDGVRQLIAAAPAIPVVVLIQRHAEPQRIAALQTGAQDLLGLDDLSPDDLRHAVVGAVGRTLRDQRSALVDGDAGRLEEQHEVFALLDGDGRVLHISDRTRRLLGIVDDSLIGESGFNTVHPADLSAAADALFAAVASPGTRQDVRLRARPVSGQWRALQVSLTSLLDHPAVGAVVVVGEDVTERNRLAIVDHLESQLLDRLPAAVVVVDEAGIVVAWNQRATSLYGYQADEALGQDVRELRIQDPAEVPGSMIATVRTDGYWEGEYDARRKDGTTVPVLATLELIEAPEIGFRGIVGASLDNSERRALRESLAHQALHDPLTNLPNRALFVDRVDHALSRLRRRPGKVAVIFVDLDRFKLINDTCGHDAGDEVLQSVASLFRAVLRPEDTVARMGGDEFAVCCEDVDDVADAVALAERLMDALSQPFVVGGREFFVSPSIGVMLGTGASGETAATLLRDADAAMYHAKDRGRGRIEVFDHGMRLEVIRRAELAGELRHALERDELRLHYQPLVALHDGALTGFEALLRWEHPERGTLAPGEFIDIAEDTNAIIPIGAWVIEQATRQLATWRDQNPERSLTMSINLSGKQINDRRLVSIVRNALESTRVDPSALCFEITESVLMEDADASVATMRDLKALGVQLAIDDFGTGYSSLAYLKRFPVDFLKIDRSFVQGVARETEDAVIVRGVIELGRALGLSVVAEGVETDGQVTELRRLSCELAQGYLWAMPRPPAEAALLLSGWTGHDAELLAADPGSAVVGPDESAVLSTAEIVSVLTHELATPLTVVKGQCERLAKLVGDEPRVSEVVAAVMRNADRIEHLVATLADAQELDSGNFAIQPGMFDIVELVRDIASLTLPEDRPREIVAPSRLSVEADGRRVEQIVVNLLTNANKFSPTGTPVVITIEGDDDEMRVIVADEGPGIPPERVGDIFRKFARLERTKKGIGLGLFLSRRLARAHGGDVHYYRRDPVGSEFVLHLPRQCGGGRTEI